MRSSDQRRPASPAVRGAAFLGLMMAGACASSTTVLPPSMAGLTPEPAPLKPGDALEVSFSLEPGQSGRYAVDENGTVSLPFLGARSVREVPPGELKSELMGDFGAQLRNQTVEVRFLRRIRVLGSVRQPGIYHVDATMSLADVVAQAGGATDDGQLDETTIVRRSGVVFAEGAARSGAFDGLRSGDQVMVPRKSWFTRNAAVLVSAGLSAVGIVLAAIAF